MKNIRERRRFWLVTGATVLALSATVSLGFWQLGRAQEKQQRQALVESQSTRAAIEADALLAVGAAKDNLYRKVFLKGRWLARHSLFLDNRQMEGKPGLILLTPFEVSHAKGEKTVFLVQRGWVARNFLNREQVPDIKSEAGEIQLFGQLAPSPSKLYEFKGPDKGLIRQNVAIPELAREFNLNLYELSVLQLDHPPMTGTPDGLKRNWPPPKLGVEKHHGYMVQWWALSALIAVLYIWFQIFRPRRASRAIV